MSFLYSLTTHFPTDECAQALLAEAVLSHKEPTAPDNLSPAAFPRFPAFKIKHISPAQVFPNQTPPDSTSARQSH